MSRVLITGGGGFVGRHVCEHLLQNGYDVLVAQRNDPKIERVGFIACDLSNPQSCQDLIKKERPDGLIHLAWTTAHNKFWEDPANKAWVESGEALLRSYLDGGGVRAIFTGSCAEYDWTTIGRDPVSEDHMLNPVTLYGMAKKSLFEKIHENICFGASLGWARLFFLYGPNEKEQRFIPSIINGLMKGSVAKMSLGHQVRDFMHVRDAGRAIAEFYLAKNVCGALNVATGNGISLKKVASKLQKLIGTGKVDNAAFPPRLGDPAFLVADVAKLRTQINFVPEFDLDNGLSDCLLYWQKI